MGLIYANTSRLADILQKVFIFMHMKIFYFSYTIQ